MTAIAPTASATPRRLANIDAALHGPIVPTMLRLAAPTMVVIVVQTLVGVAETYYVSFLGTEALAGVALVFPVFMLMAMMSNGGMGGGVSGAVARMLGAGRRDDANALVFHAAVLAVGLGLLFTAAALLGGPALYRALGGEGAMLDAALTYSDIVFIASVPAWLVALLAAALRGSGNVQVPAQVTLAGAVIVIGLSPALIFGVGPVPRLGIAGAALGVALYNLGAAAVLIAYLLSGKSGLSLRAAPIEMRLFKSILGVGAISSLGTVQTNLTVALVTAGVALFGTEAIAGYGIASRLDYLLILLLFGFGTSIVTMVAANVGAGQIARARRIAWTAAAIGAGVTELIGLAAAIFPHAWLGLFSDDPAVLAAGAAYLRIAAPFYGFFGLGMMLYFASQGANRALWPVLGGTARLILAGFVGWAAVAWFHQGLVTLYAIAAAAFVLYGVVCAVSVARRL